MSDTIKAERDRTKDAKKKPKLKESEKPYSKKLKEPKKLK